MFGGCGFAGGGVTGRDVICGISWGDSRFLVRIAVEGQRSCGDGGSGVTGMAEVQGDGAAENGAQGGGMCH